VSTGSKKVTVGYKYYLGMHMVLCHGPIDYVKSIKVDGRLAWSGFGNGIARINKPGLFGGEDKEGGVIGNVNLELGSPTQSRNSYLQSRLGNDIPAFRGVVSAVLRQVYLGMNPYLKPWAFRAQRILVKGSGQEQWYSTKAPIGQLGDLALYIAIDTSGSMAYGPDDIIATPSRLDITKEAVTQVLEEITPLLSNLTLDVNIVAWSTGSSSILRRSVDANDMEDIISFIDNLSSSGATDFEQALTRAPSFFSGSGSKPRTIVFITDGEPSPVESSDLAANIITSISNVKSYGINILLGDTSETSKIDNTPLDGVPVVTIGDSGPLRAAILNAISAQLDMNPAHIIRECLTDEQWGMGYLEADLDDESFIACADALHTESMGISLVWDKQMAIEEFVNEIIRHIDATLYVDRVTGKFTLKLIRYDYIADDLITLGPKNIQKVSQYTRTNPGSSVNSVTVTYWNYKTGENGAVSAEDIALIQSYGNVINTSIQYPGFTNESIAGRAAFRDLQALSFPLLSATIETDRTASELNIGDTFKFEWPEYHESFIIMRVNQISFGDGRKNQIKIIASEDVFALPSTPIMAEEESGWVEVGGPPLRPVQQLAFEAPYYELIQLMGETQLNNILAETPEIGYLQVAATRPEHGINAQVWVDSGAGYENGGPLDFSPNGYLEDSVTKLETSITLVDFEDLDQVNVGSHGQTGEELFRVDSINVDTGVLAISRGLLDTIPSNHSSGASVTFWDAYATSNQVEYVEGETINVKVLTNTSQGQLALSAGIESPVTMDQRAFRPYRPAGLTAGDTSESYLSPPETWYPDYPVTITWASRNRLQETGGVSLSWTDASVTPEPNTEYVIKIEAIDESGDIAGTSATITQSGLSYDVTAATLGSTYAQYPFVKVTVSTLRDGTILSRTSPSLIFRGPFREPYNLSAVYANNTAPSNLTVYTTP